MIFMIVLATWIVALAVVSAICIAAGRGDTAMRRQLIEASREQVLTGLREGVATVSIERRPSSVTRRQPEHDLGRVGRVAVG